MFRSNHFSIIGVGVRRSHVIIADITSIVGVSVCMACSAVGNFHAAAASGTNFPMLGGAGLPPRFRVTERRAVGEGLCAVRAASAGLVIHCRRSTGCFSLQMFCINHFLVIHMDMRAFIAADCAGIARAEFMSDYGVMVRWIAGAYMSMTVALFITPFTHVKVVGIVCRNGKICNLCAGIVKMLVAKGAFLVSFCAGICTVGRYFVDPAAKCMGVGIKVFVGNFSDGITAYVEQGVAVIALLILIPSLISTVRRLFGNCSFVGMGTGSCFYLDCAGGGFLSCLGGDSCFAGGYCSYLTGGTNGCNIRLIGFPRYCVGRIGRGDSCHQSFRAAHRQSQFALVEGDALCRLGSGCNGNFG